MTILDYKQRIIHLKKVNDDNEEALIDVMSLKKSVNGSDEYINLYINNTYLKQKEIINTEFSKICLELGINCESIDQLYSLLVHEEDKEEKVVFSEINAFNEDTSSSKYSSDRIEKIIFDMTDNVLDQNENKKR